MAWTKPLLSGPEEDTEVTEGGEEEEEEEEEDKNGPKRHAHTPAPLLPSTPAQPLPQRAKGVRGGSVLALEKSRADSCARGFSV